MGQYTAMHASYLAAYEQAAIAQPKIIQHLPADQIMPISLATTIFKQGQIITPTMAIFRIGANSAELNAFLHENIQWNITLANAKAVYAAGIPLIAGTDTATFPSFTMPYGLTLHCELEFLTQAGMPPAEALRSATMRAGRLQNGLHNRGVIAPGYRADLVLLNSNPVVNISNTRDIARVWTGGIEYTNITHNTKSQCSQLNLIQL
jgi:imidazolonepropionase-like amidohydrolase